MINACKYQVDSPYAVTFPPSSTNASLMNPPEYPIFLSETNCHHVSSFCFTLPPQNVGWNNITLYIEYEATADGHSTAYRVWAQFYGAVFRAYLCSGQVLCSLNDPNIIRRIIDHINNCEKFHEELYAFANCIADECF